MKIKKILATICNFCPLCNFARNHEDSFIGRMMIWHGKWCPAWKAWQEVYDSHPEVRQGRTTGNGNKH
jgi:hypothetical protein